MAMHDQIWMQFSTGRVLGHSLSCAKGGHGRVLTFTIHLEDAPGEISTTDLGRDLSTPLDQGAGVDSRILAGVDQEDDDKKYDIVGSNIMDTVERQLQWHGALDQLRRCDQVPEVTMYGLPKEQHGNTDSQLRKDSHDGNDTKMMEQEGGHILVFTQKGHIRGQCCETVPSCLLSDPVECALHIEPRSKQGLHLERAGPQQCEESDRDVYVSALLAENVAVDELVQVRCLCLDRSTGVEEEFNGRLDTGATYSMINKDSLPKTAQVRPLKAPIKSSTASGEKLTAGEYVILDWKLLCNTTLRACTCKISSWS